MIRKGDKVIMNGKYYVSEKNKSWKCTEMELKFVSYQRPLNVVQMMMNEAHLI